MLKRPYRPKFLHYCREAMIELMHAEHLYNPRHDLRYTRVHLS
jgi:hypothetical protein